MRIVDRIFPKAENFRDFSPPEGELPCKAGPFIWIFVKALRWSIICTILVSGLAVACSSMEPWFFGRLVDAFTKSTPAEAWHVCMPIVIWYLVVCQVIGRGLNRIGMYMNANSVVVAIMLVRKRLANYLLTHSYRYFQEDLAGTLAGKVVEMPKAVQDIMSEASSNVLWYIVNGTVSIAIFANIGWQFAVACITFFAACFAIYFWRIPIISNYAEKSAAATQIMRGRYMDAVSNILIVKLFGRELHEDNMFSAAMINAGVASQIERREGRHLWSGQEIINALFQAWVLLLCIQGFHTGKLSAGQVATALALALSIVLNIYWLLMLAISYFTNIAIINEALATIVVPTEVQDAIDIAPLSLARAAIDFDNVTFAYPGRAVFTDFTLAIPEDQRVGLVGPSGAGKSTLMQILLRLFDVQAGAVRIGGQDIRDVAQADLRRAIAVIPQATDLMHRSIRDNIAYGDLDAPEDRIVDAAKKAFIHDTIIGLTDSHGNKGYDALVGERGVKLSGGQRQRIAIARAFLKNAPIVVLDEATSALDSESERLIQESLAELFRGRTVIVIAHRLSTIAHLDRIVVLDEGRIVEDGTHAALLEAGALYERLWQLQSAGFIGEKVK